MQVFKLINLETQELIEKSNYMDGKKAAKVAAKLTARTGRKYQVRKVDLDAGDANWREREQARFASGEYVPLIPFFSSAGIIPPDTFPHVAKKNPSLIAYTKDELKGRADKQSLITIDGFIELCLAYKRPMIEEQVKAFEYTDVDHWCRDHWGITWREHFTQEQLKYATEITTPVEFIGPVKNPEDEEELDAVGNAIAYAYTHFDERVAALSNSCMRHRASDFSTGGIHPVMAYASPDLALALMKDTSGRTIGRAICWPEKKIYTRVYSGTSALDNSLKALGYVRSGYYGEPSKDKSFNGARMRLIENPDYSGIVAPYIDGNHWAGEKDGWLVMGIKQYNCESQNGRAVQSSYYHDDGDEDEDHSAFCESCEDNFDHDDMRTVYTRANRSRSEQWCRHCVDAHAAFYCHGLDDWFSSDAVESYVIGDQTYSQGYVSDHASYCDYYQEYTFDSVYEVRMPNGYTQTWCESACQDNAYEWDGAWYSNDIESVDVVVERYVPSMAGKWDGAHYVRHNVWYRDFTMSAPLYLIEEGDTDVYLGVDGVYYCGGYTDHHPMRERVLNADCAYPSFAHTFLKTPPVLRPSHELWMEVDEFHRIMAEERAANARRREAEREADIAETIAMRQQEQAVRDAQLLADLDIWDLTA